jgi:hypothetical protein
MCLQLTDQFGDMSTDPEDFVVARVLESLASLTEIRLFDKARMLELFSNCYGFLCHPSIWVVQGALRRCPISNTDLRSPIISVSGGLIRSCGLQTTLYDGRILLGISIRSTIASSRDC